MTIAIWTPWLGESTAWGDGSLPIWDWLGFGGALCVAFLILLRLIQGLTQADRYRAQVVLDETARSGLQAEIAKAEERSLGELAVVVVERSDRHPAAYWICGLLFLVLGSALAAPWMPWQQPALFFALQLGFGAIGFGLASSIAGLRRAFVTEARATEMAEEQSLQEFFALGLHKTRGATGVLLFVSLFERRVIVLGDEGIDAKVEGALWEAARNSVLEGVKGGDLRQGLQEAISQIGDVLADHFPPEGDNPDELPNHVIVRRE